MPEGFHHVSVQLKNTIKVMYRLTSSHQLTMHVSIQTITLIHELRHSSNVLFSYCIVLLDSKIYIITILETLWELFM